MYTNIPRKNCNVVEHYWWHLWVHPRALKGARGAAPGHPGFKEKFFGVHVFFSMLSMGIEPRSQTPESLILAFAPYRHTSCVFSVSNWIFLIRIATLLHIVRYMDSWTRLNGHQESRNGVSGHLRKIYLFDFSMVLVGIEPWSPSPKSLVITFTLWRHACKVAREKISLIYIICIQANIHKWTGSSPTRGDQTQKPTRLFAPLWPTCRPFPFMSPAQVDKIRRKKRKWWSAPPWGGGDITNILSPQGGGKPQIWTTHYKIKNKWA